VLMYAETHTNNISSYNVWMMNEVDSENFLEYGLQK